MAGVSVMVHFSPGIGAPTRLMSATEAEAVATERSSAGVTTTIAVTATSTRRGLIPRIPAVVLTRTSRSPSTEAMYSSPLMALTSSASALAMSFGVSSRTT